MNEKNKKSKNPNEQTVELSFPSCPGFERIAMACSASFAQMVGLVPDRIEDLKTAVSEVCLNAMEHGNRQRPGARVVVTLHCKDRVLSVSILDEGNGISDLPRDAEVLKKVENLEPPKGLGIYLIKRLVDQVEFNEMSNGGHVVRMTLKLEN